MIDKAYCTFKYFASKGQKLTPQQKLKNQIFDMQWAALGTLTNEAKTMYPGGFDDLKALAKDTNPSTKEYNIMHLESQIYYQHNNMAGKEMVAIAASNNPAHAMCNFAGLRMKLPPLMINGERIPILPDGSSEFDPITSPIDGSRLSKIFATFVAAAADNGKDPVLADINIIPKTANIAFAMIRAGIPVKTVVYMLKQPDISKLVSKAEDEDKSFSKCLREYLMKDKTSNDYVDDVINGTNFEDKQLLENILSGGKDKDLMKRVAAALYSYSDVSNTLAQINGYVQLNSTKNSVGPNEYTTKINEQKILDFLNLAMSPTAPFNGAKIFQELEFIKPLANIFIDVIGEVVSPYSILYSQNFLNVMNYAKSMVGKRTSDFDDKFIKKLYNAYLLYMATTNTGTKTNPKTLIDGSYDERFKTAFQTVFNILSAKNKLRDNLFLSVLKYRPNITKSIQLPGLQIDAFTFSREQRDELSASLEDLIENENEQSKNYTVDLAQQILRYTLMKNGFMASPNSPMSLIPNKLKIVFNDGDYLKAVDPRSEIHRVDIEREGIKNFLMQFVRNNLDEEMNPLLTKYFMLSDGFKKAFTSNLSNDESIVESKYFDENSDLLSNTLGFEFAGKFFYVEEIGNNYVKLKGVQPLGIKNQFMEYDSNEDFDDMKTVFNDETTKYINEFLKATEEEEVENESAAQTESSEETEAPTTTSPDEEDTNLMDSIDDIRDNLKFNELGDYLGMADEVTEVQTSNDFGQIKKIMESMLHAAQDDSKAKKTYKEVIEKIKDLCGK